MATGGCIQNTKENIQKNGLTVSGVQNKKQPWDVWQNVFFCASQKKGSQVWNDMRMTKWLNVHFSENYPIKLGSEKALNVPVK